MILNLTELKSGQSGVIVQVQGGTGLIGRLERMGIRPGKKITKVSAQFLQGPQSLKVDNLQLAVGFGMARKILVEVEK